MAGLLVGMAAWHGQKEQIFGVQLLWSADLPLFPMTAAVGLAIGKVLFEVKVTKEHVLVGRYQGFTGYQNRVFFIRFSGIQHRSRF
jgi:hypothetical protein